MDFYKVKKLRWGSLSALQADADSPWFVDVMDREKDCLAVACVLAPKAIVANVSQSINRIPASILKRYKTMDLCSDELIEKEVVVAPACLPGERCWNRQLHRFHTGFESLKIQGFPVVEAYDLVTSWSDKLQRSFAGNMFGASCILSTLAAAVLCAPWSSEKKPSPEAEKSSHAISDASDVASALRALRRR
jgi:hypothetical protein